MEQRSNQVDVESLQSGARKRGSLVDFFLGLSILVLVAAVTALAVGGMLAMKELRYELHHSSTAAPRINLDPPAAGYKAHNFAFLKPKISQLDNITMSWETVESKGEISLGNNFEYSTIKNSLKPKKVGMYFIYLQVIVSCTSKCSAGVLQLEVYGKLTCNVELTDFVEKATVSKKCWTVQPVKEEELITHLTVPEKGLDKWRLDLNRSGLGMFLID